VNGSDLDVRLAAFRFLEEQSLLAGESGAIRREVLERAFVYNGRRVPLVGPKGIFKPQVIAEVPISITTKAVKEGEARPYDDLVGADGLLRYRYRGTDPRHPDNVGLRLAIGRRTPLIYFQGIVPGLYAAAWPVYVVGDDEGALSFTVTVDERTIAGLGVGSELPDDELPVLRRYATRVFRQRLHQTSFRERVVRAYRYHCAVCRLKRQELIEAAHIMPDSDPLGEPSVRNGLALCKLHHAAFDANLIGVRPDCVILVRNDVLRDTDGPMLVHGLQGFHEQPLHAPTVVAWRPDPNLLGQRFDRFLDAEQRL
jgi:putative restriction endonuclease